MKIILGIIFIGIPTLALSYFAFKPLPKENQNIINKIYEKTSN